MQVAHMGKDRRFTRAVPDEVTEQLLYAFDQQQWMDIQVHHEGFDLFAVLSRGIHTSRKHTLMEGTAMRAAFTFYAMLNNLHLDRNQVEDLAPFFPQHGAVVQSDSATYARLYRVSLDDTGMIHKTQGCPLMTRLSSLFPAWYT